MPYYIYFAESLKSGKIYVGSTSIEPSERIKQHNSGTSTYSSRIRPLKLIYFEEYQCSVDAKKRELFYKSGIGRQIKALIVKQLNSRARSSVG